MLNFSLNSRDVADITSDCLVLGFRQRRGAAVFSRAAAAADNALNGLLRQVADDNKFVGGSGKTLLVHTPNFSHRRVLMTGLGDDDEKARAGLTAAAQMLAKSAAKSAHAALEGLSAALVESAVIAFESAAYRFRLGGHFPPAAADKDLQDMSVGIGGRRAKDVLARAEATAKGVLQTRHLAEQPGNICTPTFLAEAAAALAKQYPALTVNTMGLPEIKKMKMGALLAVAQGSDQPPRLITLRYANGAKKTPPVAIVGKGVTFDSGGISIKPSAAMDEMKFDMSGAATVLGVMLAAARAKLPLNLVGVIPACENMPSGSAVKPGDVVTAMSGKTIEVLNTDAEGRLILADALAYAEAEFAPKTVIDIATLTGACVVALGHHTSGLMGRGKKLMTDLRRAGKDSGDACWRLPLGEAYQKQLKSEYADVANIGGRAAGTITAACFLSRFARCDNWAHLDIAGTAWTPKKRATGRPVPSLMKYLSQLPR